MTLPLQAIILTLVLSRNTIERLSQKKLKSQRFSATKPASFFWFWARPTLAYLFGHSFRQTPIVNFSAVQIASPWKFCRRHQSLPTQPIRTPEKTSRWANAMNAMLQGKMSYSNQKKRQSVDTGEESWTLNLWICASLGKKEFRSGIWAAN